MTWGDPEASTALVYVVLAGLVSWCSAGIIALWHFRDQSIPPTGWLLLVTAHPDDEVSTELVQPIGLRVLPIVRDIFN